MTKQEKIQEVYEKLGFEWNICSKYITENGVLILPTPDLKYSLKGYESLIKDENKFCAFGKDGLKLQPSNLYGIRTNNGWIKIENEDDLPKNGDYDTSGFKLLYWTNNGLYYSEDYKRWKLHYDHLKITHYQLLPTTKQQPPLY